MKKNSIEKCKIVFTRKGTICQLSINLYCHEKNPHDVIQKGKKVTKTVI